MPVVQYLHVPSVNSNSNFFGYEWHPNKFQIELPDTVMLGDRQSAKGTIESAACSSKQTLVHEKLTVVEPNARHLKKKIFHSNMSKTG